MEEKKGQGKKTEKGRTADQNRVVLKKGQACLTADSQKSLGVFQGEKGKGPHEEEREAIFSPAVRGSLVRMGRVRKKGVCWRGGRERRDTSSLYARREKRGVRRIAFKPPEGEGVQEGEWERQESHRKGKFSDPWGGRKTHALIQEGSFSVLIERGRYIGGGGWTWRLPHNLSPGSDNGGALLQDEEGEGAVVSGEATAYLVESRQVIQFCARGTGRMVGSQEGRKAGPGGSPPPRGRKDLLYSGRSHYLKGKGRIIE